MTPKQEVDMKRVTLCLLVALTCFTAQPLAAESGYTLALFPIKVIANWGEGYAFRAETLAAEGIVNMIADDPQLDLKYAHLKSEDSAGTILLEDAVGIKNITVWRQTSFFANYSPNWHQVKAIGSRIVVDLAILVRIRQDDDSLIAVSLYDYKKGKIYSKTSQGVYYGSMADGVQRISEALMQDFYDNQ